MKAGTLRDLLCIRMHQLWNGESGNEMQEVVVRLQEGVDDESIATRLNLETE
jgi:hypothetical protein